LCRRLRDDRRCSFAETKCGDGKSQQNNLFHGGPRYYPDANACHRASGGPLEQAGPAIRHRCPLEKRPTIPQKSNPSGLNLDRINPVGRGAYGADQYCACH
jgi:hypothetical protein